MTMKIPAGWLSHDGGACPRTYSERGKVMLRNGHIHDNPTRWGWWIWDERAPQPSDIVAHEPEPE